MTKMDIKVNIIAFSKFMLVLIMLCCRNGCIFAVSGAAGDEVIMCKEKEREALLTFKQGLIIYPTGFGNLSSWGSEEEEKECCKWEGVLCSNSTGHVISLDLSLLQFGGEISPALLDLRHLYHLDLSYSYFGGNRIPEFIGCLQKLTYLNLRRCGFSGEVPYQLGNLTNLRTLDLYWNDLTSRDNTWLSNLTSLSQLDLSANRFARFTLDLQIHSSLTELRLGRNKLTELPTGIFQLSGLEVLDLSYNYFEGTISEIHLSKLHNLKVLALSFNSLALNFTPDWVPPFQLDEIRLARCNMGPHFPTWLQTQSNISHLDLSLGGISDEAPNWLWELSPQITYLNLSQNQLSGSIHDLSSKLLNRIDISSNNFSGPLPLFHPNSYVLLLSGNMFIGSIQSLCRVKYGTLRVLDLSNNQFSGELPKCWENTPLLFMLNLADNNFFGHLPPSLGSLIELRILHFRNNNFSGELPSTLNECRLLEFVDGGGNELTGNLPTWFGMFTRIEILILRQNNFYGSISPELCSLTFIRVLDLSRNDLSGRIPQCFENFTSFANPNYSFTSEIPVFYVDTNFEDYYQFTNDAIVQWKRQELEYKNTLKLLKLIDLSSNKLEGNIPLEFSHLAGLISLNLSRNYLTGSISSDINQMKRLECLDLSGNNLSGYIPVGLAELEYLSVLDLSNNNLSGKIPEGTQLQSFDASAYAGNEELCGAPLLNCPEDPSPSAANKRDVDDNKDHETQSSFEEYIISAVLGYVVGLWVIIGPLLFKRSWRNAYFAYLSKTRDWLYVRVTLCTTRIRYIFKLSR